MADSSSTILARVRWTLLAIALTAVVVAVVWAGPGPASAQDAGTCNPARQHDAGTFADQTITTSDEREREYLLHVPPSYTGVEALPLVFGFHGLTGTAAQQADFSQLPAKADEEGFLLVMPQGLSTELIEGFHWNNLMLGGTEADDVAFIDELLDSLEAQLCVDAARIYSTGLSNGAEMSVRLACSLSDRIAAVAPVAGVYFPPMVEELPEGVGCPLTRPVPIIAFHGTADPIIPFDGGPLGEAVGLDLTFRDIDDAILPEWAAANGCDSVPTEEPVTENVRVIRYQGCDQDVTVELYVIEGGGHTWPGSTFELPAAAEEVIGFTTQEISANDLLWDFFVAHPMPAVEAEDLAGPTSGTGPASGNSAAVWLLAVLAAGAVLLGGAAAYARRRLLR